MHPPSVRTHPTYTDPPHTPHTKQTRNRLGGQTCPNATPKEDETTETRNIVEGRHCLVLYRIVPARDGWPEASREGFTAFRESTKQCRPFNNAAEFQTLDPTPR